MWPEHMVLFAGGLAAALFVVAGFLVGRHMSDNALDVAYEDGQREGRNALLGTCDWGNCDELAEDLRWSDSHGWLPVCLVHAEPESEPEPEPAPIAPLEHTPSAAERAAMLAELEPAALEAAATDVSRPGVDERAPIAGPGHPQSPYAGELTPAQRRRDKHKRRGQYAAEEVMPDSPRWNAQGQSGSPENVPRPVSAGIITRELSGPGHPEPGDDTLTRLFGEFGTWEEQLAAIVSEGQTPWATWWMLTEVA